MVNKRLLVIAAICIMLFGCLENGRLVVFKDESSCSGLHNMQLASCYHEAAIGRAFKTDQDNPDQKNLAVADCKVIVNMGEGGQIEQSYAGEESDNCFAEVAKITQDQGICDNINSGSWVGALKNSQYDELKILSNYFNSKREMCLSSVTTAEQENELKKQLCSFPAASILIPLTLAIYARRKK